MVEIFSLTLSPADLQAFSFGFIAFLLYLAFFFLITSGWQDQVVRRFAITAFLGATLNLFAYLYHTTDVVSLAYLYRTFSQALTLFFFVTLIQFALILFEHHMPPHVKMRRVGTVLIVLLLLFVPFFIADLVFGTHLLIGPITESPQIQLSPEPGPLLIYFIAVVSLATAFVVYVMLYLWRRGRTHEAKIVGLLMLITQELPVITRLASYAPWYGLGTINLVSTGISLLTGPIFAFGVTYALLRHKVFNIRLVTTEIFIFAIWTFIFVKALLADSFANALPDIVLLIATIILGLFLIRSVLREVDQREALEVISEDLRELNENLEEKVSQRTEELALEKSHVEAIIDDLPVGIVELDHRGEIERINSTAEEILRVTRNSIIGKKQTALAKAKKYERLTAVLNAKPYPHQEKGSRKGMLDVAEVAFTDPEQLELEVSSLTLQFVDGKGKIIIFRDVTRERLLDRAKSEFVSIAAHQLRTPVSGLRWVFNYLRSGEAGRLTKNQKEIIEKGDIRAAEMARLVNDFLNVARISDDKFQYHFASQNLSQLVGEVSATFSDIAKEKGITLETHLEEIPEFSMDAEKIAILAQNLIDNALKYTPKGGIVSVHTLTKNNQAILRVKDSGIGIAREEQSRLFEKFFRSKHATEMFTDGSGLGLFIVKSIVDGHDGDIVVKSEEGKGTEFTVSFPLKENYGGK